MTDTPLTEQQLDDIAARANAATPGPWGVYEYGGGNKLDIAADLQDTGTGYRARREICSLEDEPLDNDPTHREWTAEEDWAQVQADAAFIVHAPEDVRQLVAEVRRLRDETLEGKAEIAKLRDLLTKENKRANAAIDREEAAEQSALEAQQELAAARVQAIRDLADKADPKRPEISFFGDHGHEVGAWMRKQAEYEERRLSAEETHVVADDSDDPEHVDDCPGCPAVPAVSAAGDTGSST